MNNVFIINLFRLIRQLLPARLMNSILVAYLDALVTPIDGLYSQFLLRREAHLYDLTISPQVCFMEKALNDRFDSSARRIYISPGIHREQIYIFTDAENINTDIRSEVENSNKYIYTISESGIGGADFIINIPVNLRYGIPEIRALVDRYKLAGKTYYINRY